MKIPFFGVIAGMLVAGCICAAPTPPQIEMKGTRATATAATPQQRQAWTTARPSRGARRMTMATSIMTDKKATTKETSGKPAVAPARGSARTEKQAYRQPRETTARVKA